MRLARPALVEGWPILVAVLLIAAAYANALGASFQFDDWNVIVDEPRVQSLAAWWASMPGMRPLLKLSYALNHSAGGVRGFHATNVAIHVANALLALAILERAARRLGLDPRPARRVALLGALLFALHPAQTEAVTYVSGRSTSLAALFALASLLLWIERSRVLSVAAFAAALLVKETAAVVPLAILLWEWSGPPEEVRARKIPTLHLLLLAAAALAAGASSIYRHLLQVSLEARGIGTNLKTQAHAIVYLAGQLVRVDRLNADPGLPVVQGWTARVALDSIAVAAAIALGWILLKRRPAIAFGILWFFLWLAPSNSLLPRLDVANDRQLYLPLLGPAWLLAWMLAARRTPRTVAAIAVVVIFGIATHLRNGVYADEIVFWEDVARKSPANARAFNNLGYAYALDARNDEAEAAFELALALDPAHVRSAVNLRLLREGALTTRGISDSGP